jgi:hypothetical protein
MHLSENMVGKADVGFYPKEKPGMGQSPKRATYPDQPKVHLRKASWREISKSQGQRL